MFDVNQLLAGLTQSAAEQQQLVTGMQQRHAEDSQKIDGLNQQVQAGAAALIEASKSTADKEAEIAHKIGSSAEGNARLAGFNPDALVDQYVTALAQYDSSEKERQQLFEARQSAEQQLMQMQSTDLLSNPLAYLVGQLALPQVMAKTQQIAQLEQAATERRNAAAIDLKTRVDMVKARNSIVTANTADDMLQINKAKAEQAAAQARLQLQQAQIDTISKSGARAMDAYRISMDRFEIQDKLLNKQLSIGQWQASMAAAEEARAARAEAAAARLAEKKEADAEIAAWDQRLAAVSSALGYQQPVTYKMLRSGLVPKDKAAAIMEAAVEGNFGSDPVTALTTVSKLSNPQTIARSNPGMAKMLEWSEAGLRAEVDRLTAEFRMKNPGKSPKQEEVMKEAAAAYTARVTESAQSFKSSFPINNKMWDDSGVFNPYKPQYLVMLQSATSGKIPGLKDNALVGILTNMKAELGPGETNFKGAQIDVALKALATQVGAGKLGLDKAANDIAAFHRAAAAYNADFFNYTQLGFQKQTSAIVKLPAVNMFDDAYAIDLMNPMSVKKELGRLASRTNPKQPLGATPFGFR